MLYWPFWRWDDSQKDRYGTVGTGFGAGTGAGTVQVRYGYGTWVRSVRYGYGTWVRSVRYMGTKTVPTYRTHVPYPLLSVPKVTRTQIAAEIAADLLLFLPLFGYMVLLVRSKVGTVRWGHGYTVRGYGFRTHVPYGPYLRTVPVPYRPNTHVPYLYHACIPYPHPYLHQNLYQPSRTYLFANRPTSKKANRALLLKLAKVRTTNVFATDLRICSSKTYRRNFHHTS